MVPLEAAGHGRSADRRRGPGRVGTRDAVLRNHRLGVRALRRQIEDIAGLEEVGIHLSGAVRLRRL